MSAATPLQLTPDDKLDLLRYLDEFHYWHSLDDKRHCKRCSRIITGRQIMVIELLGTRGKLRLQCPTVACLSSPSDWAYADPILAARQRALSPAIHAKAKAKDVSSQRTHRAARAAVSRKKHKPLFASTNSFRAMAARLLLLRPIATALHAFRPVA